MSEWFWSILKRLPSDFEPYGERERVEDAFDCSVGCLWYMRLHGDSFHDWGVCSNPFSPRAGLLTFEHQGCPRFEHEDDAGRAEPSGSPGGGPVDPIEEVR